MPNVLTLVTVLGKMASFCFSSVLFANDMDKYLSAHCEPYLSVQDPKCLDDFGSMHLLFLLYLAKVASPSLPTVQANT